jgi:hypothetical protein
MAKLSTTFSTFGASLHQRIAYLIDFMSHSLKFRLASKPSCAVFMSRHKFRFEFYIRKMFEYGLKI